jgi:tetratricopeptide (TPR) repeat protein
MTYTSDQFHPNEAWLVFRLQSFMQVKGKPADVYILIDLASGFVFGHIIVMGELPDVIEVYRLMKDAYTKMNAWPEMLFCMSNDPVEELFRNYAAEKNIPFRTEPLDSFNEITAPVKQAFNGLSRSDAPEDTLDSEEERETALSSIPDSYDFCPCASGLKYKFCCKKIFHEIMEAIVDAEEGRYADSLEWMKKAEKNVGRTPEILCRYAIIYSYFDKPAFYEYLEKCLALFPKHPRANYVKGLDQKNNGDYKGAVTSYTTAIKNYSPTDKYHLNEVWNNLGSAYFEMKKYADAKASWEKAHEYLPRDKMSLKNLRYMIYENPDVPDNLK